MKLLALGLVAGFAAVERKGFLQAMLSRPIALGAMAGLVAGDLDAGLTVAVPLELLWLGAVNLGAALPVHEALGTVAIAGGAALAAEVLRAGGAGGPALLPAAAAAAVVLCAPLALLGRRAERLVERWNERLYARAEHDLALGDDEAAARVNLYGIALPFAISFLLAPLGALVSATAIPLFLERVPGALPPLALGLVTLSAFSCAAGAKAMRAARAKLVYFAGLLAGLGLFAATVLAGGGP
ncbi:MAG TPA: PTS sugar transporter subunit IIC [Anaeromyxobacteraceae bacterium]|nr:PTS sugar transporter subunit IIC [Anaeromyxobacteraceae bacterium]